jgi:hypothetical protein
MHEAAIVMSERIKQLHWQFFHNLLVMIGISLVKISIAFFLLRLVISRPYKIFLISMIGEFARPLIISGS